MNDSDGKEARTDQTDASAGHQQNAPASSLSSLSSKSMEFKKVYQLKYPESSMHSVGLWEKGSSMEIIGNEIWITVPEHKVIEVLQCDESDDCRKIRTVTVHKVIRSPGGKLESPEFTTRSIAQTEDGRIVVATVQGVGHSGSLLMIDSYGRVTEEISSLTDDCYAEVRAYGRYVYGLHYKAVSCYERSDNEWACVKTIQLQHPHQNFCVFKETLTLSQKNFGKDGLVCKYDINTGKEIARTISSGSSRDPGHFRDPYVGVCDKDGNVAICDYFNGRVQILKHDNSWEVFKDCFVSNPSAAAFDSRGNLFVLSSASGVISKLVPRLEGDSLEEMMRKAVIGK